MKNSHTLFFRRSSALLFAGGVALLAGSSLAQSPTATFTVGKPVPPASQTNQPSIDAPPKQTAKRSFLWSVRSPNNTVYLFGTIHVGKRSFYPLPAAVETALRASKRLAVEADISNQAAAAEVAKLIARDAATPLESRINQTLLARTKVQLERLKIPFAAVQSMKPYLLGGLLSIAEFSRLGYDMSSGVDAYLISAAKQQNKTVVEIESQLAQITLLDALSPELQEAFLDNIVSTLESGKGSEQVRAMVHAWQTGESAMMAAVVAEANRDFRFASTLDELLVYGRHLAMVNKISDYLKSNEVHFVAVGSLHLVGERGLVALLKARGYQVVQL